MKNSYIFFGLLIIFIGIVAYNGSLSKEISGLQTQYLKEDQEKKEVTFLKDKWSKNKNAENKLNALLQSNTFKDLVKSNSKRNTTLKAELENLDKDTLKNITQTIFDNQIQVREFTLNKRDKHKADFSFGVEF